MMVGACLESKRHTDQLNKLDYGVRQKYASYNIIYKSMTMLCTIILKKTYLLRNDAEM